MVRSKAEIFKKVHETAAKLGACDPHWLKAEQEPPLKTVEPGGTGAELILLHGLLGALSNWDTTLPLFTRFSKPIALEFPILTGHRSEVKVKALAAMTEYLILQRGLEPVSLCGNSLGGHVALRLALAAPDLVDCLVLSGASGLYEHSVDALPVRPDKNFIRDHMRRVFRQERFVTDEAVDEIHSLLSKRMNVLNLIHAARSAKKDNLLHELKHVRMPTLLLWGEEDEVTTMSVAETFASNIPNSTLVSIKGCGHAPMIEHPEWFADQVNNFLAKHSKRAGKTKS